MEISGAMPSRMGSHKLSPSDDIPKRLAKVKV